MRYVHRELGSQVIVAARHFPALVLTGPRRSGKTFLLHFRDQQGLEVDFVLPGRGGAVRLVEAKAARPVTP